MFVDGWFWCGCKRRGSQAKGNKRFWLTKLEANKARDRRVSRRLGVSGWYLQRVWEHDLRLAKHNSTVIRVYRMLRTHNGIKGL